VKDKVEDDPFKVRDLVSLREMFDVRMHLGHKRSLLNPYMAPFIYGARFDQLIIDVTKSAEQMVNALNFVAHIAYKDGVILFISRHHQTSHKVEECAHACHEFAHTRRWLRGLFTNSTRIFGTETRLPDCTIFLSTKGSETAISESAKMLIPSVGICDTDSDPRLICYPIAGNDDTPDTIDLYCKLFKTAVLRGKMRRKLEQEDEAAREKSKNIS